MKQRRLNQEWRKSTQDTRYPFSSTASLISQDGRVITEGTICDAALYPIGGRVRPYLSQVTLTHRDVTVYVGDSVERLRASATFNLVSPPDLLQLEDDLGRPAGVVVSESARLGLFQSWGVGEHRFEPAASEFCATVYTPTPEVGLRGVRLPDGSILTGDVWLVGEDGVVLRTEDKVLPGGEAVKVVRLDVVGDPLFRRRLCTPNDLFVTPRFVKTIRVLHADGEFDCVPDEYGNVRLFVDDSQTPTTVLRVRTTADGGVVIEMAGTAT